MSSSSDWCFSTLRGPGSCECLVPKRGLEPPRALAHYPLKIACLPIPPLRLRHARPECASDRALNHISQTHCRGETISRPLNGHVGMTKRWARNGSLRGRNGDGVGATHWVALGHPCQRARSWLGQSNREAVPRGGGRSGHGRGVPRPYSSGGSSGISSTAEP